MQHRPSCRRSPPGCRHHRPSPIAHRPSPVARRPSRRAPLHDRVSHCILSAPLGPSRPVSSPPVCSRLPSSRSVSPPSRSVSPPSPTVSPPSPSVCSSRWSRTCSAGVYQRDSAGGARASGRCRQRSALKHARQLRRPHRSRLFPSADDAFQAWVGLACADGGWGVGRDGGRRYCVTRDHHKRRRGRPPWSRR